jgi:hypothetical protein
MSNLPAVSNIKGTLLRRAILLIVFVPLVLIAVIVYAGLEAVDVVQDAAGGFREAWRGKL